MTHCSNHSKVRATKLFFTLVAGVNDIFFKSKMDCMCEYECLCSFKFTFAAIVHLITGENVVKDTDWAWFQK